MKEITAFSCEFCDFVDKVSTTVAAHEEEHIKERIGRVRREASGHLTIAQIIQKCEGLPNLPVIVVCDSNSEYDNKYPDRLHSYRGSYEELGIDIGDKPIFLEFFLKEMRFALCTCYGGWKGGQYWMNSNTFVWVANQGEPSGLMVTDVCLSIDGNMIQLIVKPVS